MISQVEAPMELAASMRPRSTSASLDSTMRATNGAAEMMRGNTAAGTPRVVPTTTRVTGMMKSKRMMNGSERAMLTSQPRAE